MDDYKSPIEIIYKDYITTFEDNIYKAIQEYNIIVDKDELIRALKYDRDQFRHGYLAGFSAGRKMASPIPCGNCQLKETRDCPFWFFGPNYCADTGFCWKAIRKNDIKE